MRKMIAILLVLFSLVLSVYPQKKALLVGVSDYPEGSGWHHINSQNDLKILGDVLEKRGFFVDILAEDEAVLRNITNKLQELSDSAHAGDTLLIHFSSHGQQMLALNDSTETDGLDESIVPYDAEFSYSDSYNGDRHLKDDTLSAYIGKIAQKIGDGGLVIVTIDACHSDAHNRGENENTCNTATVVRGTSEIFDYGHKWDRLEADSLQEDTVVRIEKNGADVFYISACRSDEKNYECVVGEVGYGSLSYCIYDLLKNNPASLDMKIVLDSLYYKMKGFHRQHMSTRNTLGYMPKEEPSKPLVITRPSFIDIIKENWLAFSAIVVILILSLYLIWRKK